MHSVSIALTDYFITKEWISSSDRAWSIYTVETKLLGFVFFCVIAVLSLVLGVLPQAAVFTLVFYNLRRRMGGVHASRAWVCQVLSVSIVLCVTLIIGPAIQRFPSTTIISLDVLVLFLAFITKPQYPPQTHFEIDVIFANNKRKNTIISFIIIMQYVLGYTFPSVLVYSLLGVFAGLLSVYIELLKHYFTKDG